MFSKNSHKDSHKDSHKEENKSKKDCKITATNFTDCIKIASEGNKDPIILCDDAAIKYLDCMLSLEKKITTSNI